MNHIFRFIALSLLCSVIEPILSNAQSPPKLLFDFEGNVKSQNHSFTGKGYSFTEGIDGKAILIQPTNDFANPSLEGLELNGTKDFSVQFWVKTSTNNPMVLLSQKDFSRKGITTQKNAGWALYTSGGTFAWTTGSGERRINYERDNGEKLPIGDNKWHQIAITYSKTHSEMRLYYDGHNRSIYKIGFDFSNNQPLLIGSVKNGFDFSNEYLPEIESGAKRLQELVDAFNQIGLEPLKNDELFDFISNTEKIFEKKSEASNQKYSKEDLSKTLAIKETLLPNPYTVYQVLGLTMLKPISKIYSLKEGQIIINDTAARTFTKNEKLHPSDFAMDNLSIWESTISPEEILNSYNKYSKSEAFKLDKKLKELTVGVWNIWNGGIHWSLEKDGWDSRMRIVEIIKEKKADVILMQETYSAGDFIAAELGYYFATTSDFDYRYQGANISVLSRYPISEIKVEEKTSFNNVAVKLTISKSQEIWAMSNWYGMRSFPVVYDFHKSRFDNSDKIPVLFGGDFNAVPHTDGGKSPASKKMLENGFTDVFRSSYPDVKEYPGKTHRSGSRIDQLYYKGKGISHKSAEVISDWPSGFPSDHYMILSEFELKN